MANQFEPSKGYSIGEFATINHISARMLRHYDKIGLFKPQQVLANGYRYYSSEQLPAIALIKKYQTAGFTLAEIAVLLDASAAKITVMAKEKQRQLTEQDIKFGEANALLVNLLGASDGPLPDDGVVALTQQPKRQLACGLRPVSENEIDPAFDELYSALENTAIQPIGLAMLLGDSETALYQVAVPIQSNSTPTKLTSRVLPSGSYLSTFYYGNYDNIGTAYDRLLRYARQRNQQPVMPFIERYFLDQAYTTNPNDYITEISLKVTP